MKKIIIIILVLSFASIYAQTVDYTNYNQSVGIRVFAGYNSFDLSDAKNFFRDGIEYYNNLNIGIKEQTLYPPNSLFGFGVYFFPQRELELNIDAELTSTKAISLYGDQFGTIDLKSPINLFSVSLGIKKYFMDIDPIQPFVGLDFGIIDSKYEFSESIKYNQNPNYIASKMDYSKMGYKAEVFIGASYNLWAICLDINLGYKYSNTPKPESEDFNIGNYFGEAFELNNSGFVVKVGVRTGIYL